MGILKLQTSFSIFLEFFKLFLIFISFSFNSLKSFQVLKDYPLPFYIQI